MHMAEPTALTQLRRGDGQQVAAEYAHSSLLCAAGDGGGGMVPST